MHVCMYTRIYLWHRPSTVAFPLFDFRPRFLGTKWGRAGTHSRLFKCFCKDARLVLEAFTAVGVMIEVVRYNREWVRTRTRVNGLYDKTQINITYQSWNRSLRRFSAATTLCFFRSADNFAPSWTSTTSVRRIRKSRLISLMFISALTHVMQPCE